MSTDITVRELTEQEATRWDSIVARFKNRRVFHRYSWIRSIEAFSGAKPLFLVIERHGDIVGCFPGFIVRVGPLKLFCSPREGWQTGSMGPLFHPEAVSSQLVVGTAVEYLERQHRVHYVELVSQDLEPLDMQGLGFEGHPLFTHRAPLFPGDEEKALKTLKAKTRNQLRKAIKQGLVAEIETEESFVDEFYDQIREVFTRRGNAVPFSRERVLQLYRHMRASGNLLAVSVRMPEDRTCAATGLYLLDGNEMYLWGWTHRTEYGWYCPTELLTWTAIRKAMDAGCATFDMAGGGGAKKKFGAMPDEAGYRWIRTKYAWLKKLRAQAKSLYRWQQSLRGRLTPTRRAPSKD
jgi:CelD/BcsL family acetyltransferase involved in cellulose biosynthesis